MPAPCRCARQSDDSISTLTLPGEITLLRGQS